MAESNIKETQLIQNTKYKVLINAKQQKYKTVKFKTTKSASGPSKTIRNRNLWAVMMAGACDASG